MTANTKSPLWQITFYDIYTQSFRSFRFIPFRSVFLSRSLSVCACVCIFCWLICVCLCPWPCLCVCAMLCCAVNTKHVYTHSLVYGHAVCVCTHKNAIVLCGWFFVSLTRVSALNVDLVCRACLHVVPLAPTHWVLALLLLLFYLLLVLAPL